MDTNHKPYDSLRIQISKVSDMADIGSRFSEAVSVDHLLSLILKQTLDLMNAGACIIWLKDKSGNLIPRISFGLKTSIIQSAKLKLGSSLVNCIMKKDNATNIYNLARDKRISVSIKKLIKKEGLKSLLATPLMVGEDRIGVLMICTKRRQLFTDVELKIFNALSKQAALAITNISLYDRMGRVAKEKMREMSALFTMSRSISSSPDLDTVLDLILEKTRSLVNAKFCVLKVLGNLRRHLAVVSASGIGKDKAREFSSLENSIYKKVRKTGMPIIISEVETYFKNRVPAHLKRHKIHSIIMVPLFSKNRKSGVLAAYMPEFRIFEREDIEMLGMVANLCALAIDNSQMLERVKKDYLNMINTLAKIIDANDPYTRGHCDKVMKYSLGICKNMNVDGRLANNVRTASLLHDIGKVGIDLSIIRKRGKLSKRDWKQVRMHPEIGARIVSQVGFLTELVPLIRYHHEYYKGGGYPEPDRCREKIPLGARIIAVADAFDAMTSSRPYRKAMKKEDAKKEIRNCAGSQFDPKVVSAFLRCKV